MVLISLFIRVEKELKLKTYYIILRAVRESTMTTLRRYEYRVGNTARVTLEDACFEFEQSLGPGWSIMGEIVPRQYFDSCVAVQLRHEQLLLRGEGGV